MKNVIKNYLRSERYLESLLNLSIVKKVPSGKRPGHIGDKTYEEYFKEEGVSGEDVLTGMGLKRMKALMEKLDHPYKNLKVLHIAGTSGKGSVSTIAHEILKRMDLTVSLYTSPHLTLVMERIKVNDHFICPKDFVRHMKSVKKATDDMYENDIYGPPSYHETIFSAALLYFREEKPDLSVIETGLGWKNDYTKILPSSLVSVITNISFDHMDYLGDSLSSIASHKADIISPKSICITGCRDSSLLEIIEAKALKKSSQVIAADRDYKIELIEKNIFNYKSRYNDCKELELSLTGAHQMENAGTAIAAVEQILLLNGLDLDEDIIRKALKEVKIPGRIEIISKNPSVIIDGAHNPAKMEVLSKTLQDDFSFDKLIIILGVIEGKDIRVMLEHIAPMADLIIATLPRVAGRVSVSPRQIVSMIKELGGKAIIKLDPFDALDYALSITGEKDLLCITGSLYLAGELRTHWVSKEDIITGRSNI
jgi:dihydrofolate synthase/folylpolyglutamate synthase